MQIQLPTYQSNQPITLEVIRTQFQQLREQEKLFFNQIDIYQLLQHRSQFFDQFLIDLWQHFMAQNAEDFALVAVGGYGREEMFPLSDIDILILTQTPLTKAQQQMVADLIQFLWDCKLQVGHSVRTLAECMDDEKTDISIATNLLESRFLAGNTALFNQLVMQIQEYSAWSKADFFAAKLSEKEERYQRYHNTGYNLEPDLKYSPGGLRDLHLLYWIALKHVKANNLAQVLASGFIYPEEYQALTEARTLLFRLRFALHLIINRYDNRLLFDRQLKISQMLGYDGEGNQAVELMMKAYFQASQAIIQLSEVLILDYQEQFIYPCQQCEPEKVNSSFQLLNKAIQLRQKGAFEQEPTLILDLFIVLTQQPDTVIHSSTLRQLRLALLNQKTFLVENALARKKFIQLLSLDNVVERALKPMHRYGVLSAYLPAWQQITGLMQFDLFHSYTVDEHTIRLLTKLESFAKDDNEIKEMHPICSHIFTLLPNKIYLYLAALFHDIAKGRGGDHAELGAIEMYDFALLHDFSDEEAELMAWLVLDHLTMSVTAQRRDIHDPEEIRSFASLVREGTRLDYLLCLTVADICATNQTLWNSWKRSLLATLYQYTRQQLSQGVDTPLDNRVYVLQNRTKTLDLLQPLLVEGIFKLEDINQLWQRCPDDYFLRNTPKQIAWHTEHLCRNRQQDVVVLVSSRFSRGGTEVFVYCPDQANLFHKVVTTLQAKNVSIHDAQIITSKDGYVFDSFVITEPDGKPLRKARRDDISQVLSAVLNGTKSISVSKKANNHRLQHFTVPMQIRFLHTQKTEHTELELFALDEVGLLATVSQIFIEQGLNLINAKITTIGEKAEDFFILTNEAGTALNKEQCRLLQLRLESELTNKFYH